MSREIHTVEPVTCAAYVGPARTDDMARTRYQFAVVSEQDGTHHTASLDVGEFIDLFNNLEREVRIRGWAKRE